ncbi:TY-Chap domain-containing protein [Arenibaculum pallidiluteum]|uniref:TY-Chap domain-containing protein n=1 Tax=Arenibaculum pallidiluteum TaxID=2812559 RepID=UPI001A961B73|nr:hypothetical protein [Arenibaculum pallidiluteum]
MGNARTFIRAGLMLISGFALEPTVAAAQQTGPSSCAGTMTLQLRRYSESCLTELVSYVATHPRMAAKIAAEDEKYYVIVTNDGSGVRAEAVSKFNYPLMKDSTADSLKQLGWQAPENEGGNWTKHLGTEAAAVEEVAKALRAYGMDQAEALSLTIGTEVTG